jgi:hypothetical protein
MCTLKFWGKKRYADGNRGSGGVDPQSGGTGKDRSVGLPGGSGSRKGREKWESTNPNLGEDALLLEGAGDERLELHHLAGVVVHHCGVWGWGGGAGAGAPEVGDSGQQWKEGKGRSKMMSTAAAQVGVGIQPKDDRWALVF